MAPRSLTRTLVDVEIAKISTQLDNQDNALAEIKATLNVAVTKETHEDFKREILAAILAINIRHTKIEDAQTGFLKMIIGAYGLTAITLAGGAFVVLAGFHHP